jgi:hypothetical protein
MHPAADVLDRRGRLAVKNVEGALGVKPKELGVRLSEPDRIVLMPRSVHEDVPDAVDMLLSLTFRVPGGNDRDLVAGTHEPSTEVARVILHTSDAVLGNDKGDDADPHRLTNMRSRASGSCIRYIEAKIEVDPRKNGSS